MKVHSEVVRYASSVCRENFVVTRWNSNVVFTFLNISVNTLLQEAYFLVNAQFV